MTDRLPPWTNQDSRALDRENTAMRRPSVRNVSRMTKTQNLGPPRGETTDEELARRRAADRHLAPNRPTPIPLANGEWLVKFQRGGVRTRHRFPARQDAEAWITEQLTEEH